MMHGHTNIKLKINYFTLDVIGYNEADPTEVLSPSNSRPSGRTKYICFEAAV